MALNLSIPVSTRPLPKELETNPKKAKAWIESLPMTKTAESTKAVTETIEALNHAKMPAEERVALLDCYRPIITVLLDELEAIYAYASLPLQPKQQEAYDLAHRLMVQCANTYKMQLMEKGSKLAIFGAKKTPPAPAFWAMYYLQSMLMQSFRVYHPCAPSVWQEMHSIFLYAAETGIANEAVASEVGATLNDLYIDALMVSLADPYRLMNQEVDRVLDVLKQYRGHVDLRDNAEGLNPQRLFVVAFDSDTAPKVLVQGGRPPGGQVLRLVDPGRLVDKLQQKMRAQSSGVSATKSKATHDLTDLTHRLIRLWGDPPKRQFRRNPTDSAVALCSSIRGIAYFTELASQEDPEADAQAIRDGDTVPLLKIPQDETSQSIGVEPWHVLNQSANGLRMHREAGGKVSVTVGEVVGVRFVGGRTWNVGVVRWLTLLEGNALEFGVELVAPAADSITIEPTIGSNGRPAAGLRLLPLTPGAESDTLLAAPDTFADLREFELANNAGEYEKVRATTLIERTSRFEMFQFQSS